MLCHYVNLLPCAPKAKLILTLRVGQGQGRAGQGRAGQGRAGQGSINWLVLSYNCTKSTTALTPTIDISAAARAATRPATVAGAGMCTRVMRRRPSSKGSLLNKSTPCRSTSHSCRRAAAQGRATPGKAFPRVALSTRCCCCCCCCCFWRDLTPHRLVLPICFEPEAHRSASELYTCMLRACCGELVAVNVKGYCF